MFSTPLYRIVIKYGLLSGLMIVVFATLKSGWYLSGRYPDLYITLIAAVFICIGFYVSKRAYPKEMTDQLKEGETEDSSCKLYLLSKRELKVLPELYTDSTNKEIAGKLCIELSTLKTHINSIYKKLEVKNRVEFRVKWNRDVVFKQLII